LAEFVGDFDGDLLVVVYDHFGPCLNRSGFSSENGWLGLEWKEEEGKKN